MPKYTSEKPSEQELISYLEKKLEAARNGSEAWRNNQDKFHRLRMRIKKTKTTPFVGCSNIRMPTAETKIRKLKAAIINVLFGIRPVVQAIPTPSGTQEFARKIEKFLDHLIMNVIQLKPKAVIGVDRELEGGFCILHPYYRVETTTRIETFKLKDLDVQEAIEFFDPDKDEEALVQILAQETEADMSERVLADNEAALRAAVRDALSGEDEIEIRLKDVLYDAPDVMVIPAEDFIAPADGGFDVQKLQFCGYPYFISLNEAEQNVEELGWDENAIAEIKAYKGTDCNDSKLKVTKDQREGIQRLNNPSELIKFVNMFCWMDLNGDGRKEKVQVTYAAEFKKIVRKRTLDSKSGRWPFVKIYYELIDDRWFSHRGVVELIEDIIKEIDIQHMQKIDQQTIRNAPMFMYRVGQVNPNMIQFIPNQAIPIHGMADLRNTIDVLNNNNPNVEMSYEREEQILLGRIEEMIGQVDFTLQSQINRREPRTFGEVSLQAQSQQQVFSLDASLHIDAFSQLYEMIWELWSQYGPDQYEFEYFGEGKWESMKITREEAQGKYRLGVRGNDQNTNPQVRLQKAQTVIQGATNQIAVQMGVITPQKLANAMRYFYNELDIPDAENFFEANPQAPVPPEPKTQIIPKFADLEEGEQAQVLISMGIQPDVAGMMLKRNAEMIEQQQGAIQNAEKKQEARKPKASS